MAILELPLLTAAVLVAHNGGSQVVEEEQSV